MATAADLIKSSMRLIGAIASGETPTASELSDGLDALNDILEDWSNDGFMIFETKIEEFTLTPGTAAYTIGSGATFDTARPQIVQAVKFKKSGGDVEFPGRVYSAQEWQNISLKTTQNQIPDGVFYNRSVPSGTLNFWPVPSAATTVVLHSLKPLTAIASSATTLSYPPGYKKALKYELADDLAMEFGKDIPNLGVKAARYKAGIARTNTEPLLLVPDAFGLTECRPFNFEKGSV